MTFGIVGLRSRFSRNTNLPIEILMLCTRYSISSYRKVRYRSTGVMLVGLEVVQHAQLDLFGESFKIDRYERLFTVWMLLRRSTASTRYSWVPVSLRISMRSMKGHGVLCLNVSGCSLKGESEAKAPCHPYVSRQGGVERHNR